MSADEKTGMFSTPPFRVIVGPNATPFYSHPEVLSKNSKVLAEMVQGSFRESKDKVIMLDDIDPEVFWRALQFMYSGQYSVPDPLILQDLDEDATVDQNIDWDVVGLAKGPVKPDKAQSDDEMRLDSWGMQTVKKPKFPRRVRDTFCEECGWQDASSIRTKDTLVLKTQDQLWKNFTLQHATINKEWEPRANESPYEDYAPILLCHAELYVFANRYCIESLEKIALHRLQKTLVQFRLFRTRIEDIVQLVRYSFENTVDKAESVDELRNLVLQYSICHIEVLMADEDFQGLMSAEGSLAVDVVQGVLRLR